MGCQKTKCSTPDCTTSMKACKLINGKCPACHQKAKMEDLKNDKKKT